MFSRLPRFKLLSIVMLLVVTLTSSGFLACGQKGSTPAEQTKYEQTFDRLAEANAQVKDATRAAFEGAVILGDQNLITPEQELAVHEALTPVAIAFDEFNAVSARQYAAGRFDKATLLARLSDVNRAIQRLNQQRALYIKNPDSQTKFDAAINGFNAAVVTLTALVNGFG